MNNKKRTERAIQEILRQKKHGRESAKFSWDKLNEAFRVFWASEPTEREFSRVMNHCPLSATMLYILQKTNA